jgi:simple sugar transport system ATP-binding protein
VGRDVLLRVQKSRAQPSDAAPPALRLEKLTAVSQHGVAAVHELDLEVRPGEIVGIAGVQGNGQDELIQTITGFRKPRAGAISIGGRDLTGGSPAQYRAAGIAYVPADRGRTGLSLDCPIWENMALGHHRMGALGRRFFFNARRARKQSARFIETFDIRGATPDKRAGSLSGGNQQKVVLSRELSRDVGMIVIEQPSQGVDIGAIESIHRLLVGMRDAGKGILLVSADLDEVMSLSDRIAVMFRGRILETIDADGADIEHVGALMGGLRAGEGVLT